MHKQSKVIDIKKIIDHLCSIGCVFNNQYINEIYQNSNATHIKLIFVKFTYQIIIVKILMINIFI